MSAQCPRLLVLCVGLLVIWGMVEANRTRAQPDSVRTKILKEKGFSPDHSPTGALWRSAAVPGWGQYYNRQYYKIPFVYAGFAALAYRIITAHQDYQLFKRAHLFGRGPELSDGDENPYQQYQSQFNEVTSQLGTERLSVIRSQRDQFRRRRDLSILWTGLFYGLNVLDAYVSAHLLTFDVGDTMDMQVRPGRLQMEPSSPLSPDLERRTEPGALLETRILQQGPAMQVQLQF